MSDLYDSLEDECDEKKYASGSPDEYETPDRVVRTPDCKSPKKFSFYLRESTGECCYKSFPVTKTLLNERQKKKRFLPKLDTNFTHKGLESVRNTILQNQILNEQGLQLNKDGSITKSPRWEKEELPFITREYRNLQFQKKKTYADNKKISSANTQKKIAMKDVEKSGDENYPKQIDPSKRRRSSFERLISGNSLSLNSTQLKVHKPFTSNYNMTDSMKERLLQTQKDSLRKSITGMKNVGKPNCEISSNEISNVPRQNKNDKSEDQMNNFRFAHRLQKKFSCLESNQKQFKTHKSKIHGYLSDISLTTLRPKLNYSERHKLENGFNIFHLKQLNKKVESDTNRSNFGDSVMEELPEVSSVPASCNPSAREDEETFYQKLIEKDKCLKQQNHYSARSEGPVYIGKLRSQVLQERKNIFKSKDITKSKDIDLDIEVDNLVNTFKKCSHYCPANSSTNPTKVELALKGKTYGYLANARNIFRLKAISERKIAAEKEESIKVTEDVSPLSKKISDLSRGTSNLNKHNSSSIGIFPNVKGGQPRYLEKSPRGKNDFSKTKIRGEPHETQKKIVLPQVCCQKVSISKTQCKN